MIYKANIKLKFDDNRTGTRRYTIEIKNDVMYIYRLKKLILELDLKAFDINEDYDKFICDYFEGFYDGNGKPLLIQYLIERA